MLKLISKRTFFLSIDFIHQYEAITAFHLHDLTLTESAIQEIECSKFVKSIQEEIRVYETYRYLKKDETTRRSQVFMHLLFLTVRYSFDWPIIQKQTAKTYAQLLVTPHHLSTIDIEIVPYEVLWGRVGEILGGEEARVNRKALSIDLFRHFFYGWEGKN